MKRKTVNRRQNHILDRSNESGVLIRLNSQCDGLEQCLYGNGNRHRD